jgi:uncharacterized protein YkwD
VHKANSQTRYKRSVKAALSLALVYLAGPACATLCPLNAARAADGRNLASASPPQVPTQPSSDATSSTSGDIDGGTPVTRVARPHTAPTASPEIKLMPLQPTLDVGPKVEAPHDVPGGAPAVAPSYGKGPVKGDGSDPYPTIGKLESVTLGAAQPSQPINDRLAKLETAVFKHVYSGDSLYDRTERLKNTLLGPETLDPNSAAARDHDDLMPLGRSPGSSGGLGGLGGLDSSLGLGVLDPTQLGDVGQSTSYLDELALKLENQEAAPPNVLNQFALEIVNYERRNGGLSPLINDVTADKVAEEHVKELSNRSVISHFSVKGDNPDRRYTMAGGSDAMVESVASLKTSEPGNNRLSKAAVAKIVKSLLGRQDDRDALMSPDASHFGFSIAQSADKSKLLSAFEVIARHGVVDNVPVEVSVGDKLEIKGTMEAPYVFDRITVAWEATNNGANPSSADESEEALPYFPPLDYVAYAGHSDHDYHKTILALKTIGVVAAIAGGVFIPPVALAAPLIIMSGNPGGEAKPVSDIPIKGGVKVEGASFDAKIPLSNNNKEGLYYITIYGSLGSHSQQSIPVSRRVVMAKPAPKDAARDYSSESARTSKPSKADKDARKKSKNGGTSAAPAAQPAGTMAQPPSTRYDDEVTGKVEGQPQSQANTEIFSPDGSKPKIESKDPEAKSDKVNAITAGKNAAEDDKKN